MIIRIFCLLTAFLFLFIPVTYGQINVNDFGFSGQFFLSYDHISTEGEVSNEFILKRGYITFRGDIHERISVRFTQDVTIDQEGDGEGDIELRLKYALVNLTLNDLSIIRNPRAEVGVISRPWVDFEQSINDFRSQESMFLDNNKILVSADYGVSLSADLGDALGEEERESIGSDGGRYGSFHFGVYNGGGYSALEKNRNKVVEGRLTLRPLPYALPGLQTSFFGSYGRGNIPESPDFTLTGSGISYESSRWTTLLQGFWGEGDSAGLLVDEDMVALPIYGWSFFHELKPFSIPVSLLGRYDNITHRESGELAVQEFLGGVAYTFPNSSKIILSYKNREDGVPFGDAGSHAFSVITEIRF